MSYEYKNSVLNDIERLDVGMYFTDEDGIHNSEDKVYELREVYAKAEAYDVQQEVLNKLVNEYDEKARAEFKHGFIGPATEALDIKKKIKNIVDYESEAD